mgnify:CR=1 FL=1
MNRRIIIYLLLSIFVLLGLISYNYSIAQKNIKDLKQSPLSISLDSFPAILTVGEKGRFTWSVNAAPDLSTPLTTIYYGYTSTPSALTKGDSPDAVGYPLHLEDYAHGSFKLPDTFDANLQLKLPGKIFLRAYAKVGKEHLWTEEKYLEIVPRK